VDENLNTIVIELIKESISTIEKSKEFVSDQLPDIVQQLLYWYFMSSLTKFIFSISILFISIYLAVRINTKIYKKADTIFDDDMFGSLIITTLGLLCILVFSVKMFTLTWLQIYIAPKVFLIEYINTLIK